MNDSDLCDLARHAISDAVEYHRRQMFEEDASGSVKALLSQLLDREPTADEIEDALEG